MPGTDPAIKRRIYFYVNEGQGVRPESGVGGYAHQVRLNNLYDPTTDGAALWRQGKGDTNASESAIVKAGYDGYYVRNFANQAGVAVLLGSHSVPVKQLGMLAAKMLKGDLPGHDFHGNQWTGGDLPAEPGTMPVKDGYVRLYHQTDAANIPSIMQSGISIDHAKGIEGPRAVYASQTGFYGKPGDVPTIEFQVPKDKWDDPFVLQDVKPSDIIAAHLPWHDKARYLIDNPSSMQEALSGEFDDLTGDYAPAVAYVKAKYGAAKLMKLIKSEIDDAAHQAATSLMNLLPQPTQAQREAGNYKMGHINVAGLDITIENPAGSQRNPDWPAMKDHYGYVKGTDGADGDEVDIFVKPGIPSDWTGSVFVIDQVDADGVFDEHKCMVGYDNEADATASYLSNFTPGWRLGTVTPMSLDEFKAWLASEATSDPVSKASLAALVKGDLPGHEFHGNQYTTGLAGNIDAASVNAQPTAAVSASQMTPQSVLGQALYDKAMRAVAENKMQAAPGPQLTEEQKVTAAAQLAPALAAAAADKPAFDQKLEALGKQLGAQIKTAGIKGGLRLLEKHVFENDSVTSKMRDLVRGSLVVRTPEEAQAALKQVGEQFQISRVKDRFPGGNPGPTEAGYSDILTNVRLPGGIDGEIQIHIPEMLSAKEVGHLLYDTTRQMGDNNPRKGELLQMQSEIYDAAKAANQRSNLLRPVASHDSNSARVSGSPSVPAFKALRYGYSDPSARNATQSPDGNRTTGTESTSRYADSAGILEKSIFTSLTPIVAYLQKFNPNHDERGRFAAADNEGAQLRNMFNRVRAPDGGFTYSPTSHTEPSTGYALSIHPDRSVALDSKTIQFRDLARYAASNADLLHQPGNHIGAWNDPASGKVFLDVSMVTNDKAQAEKLALQHDQIAYFDLSNFQSVTVNPDAKSGGAATKADYGQARTVDDPRERGRGARSAGAGDPLGKADRQKADERGGPGGSATAGERQAVSLAALAKEFTAPTSATSGIQPYGSGTAKKRKARRKPRPKINGRTVSRTQFDRESRQSAIRLTSQ